VVIASASSEPAPGSALAVFAHGTVNTGVMGAVYPPTGPATNGAVVWSAPSKEAEMGRRGRPGMGLGAGPMMRGGRRPVGQRVGPGARARLLEAHELKRQGKFADAAARFTEMAAMARERGMPRMASTLSAQAAQCHAQAGNQQGLIASTEAAIGDAKVEGDAEHSSRTFGELLGSLSGTQFGAAAPQFEGAIRNALGVAPAMNAGAGADVNRTMRRQIPAECEGCGAPVSSADVKFNDTGHADCPYCGSILTA
jgi:hypothetical protein